MKWVTWEHVGIDRIGYRASMCAQQHRWLIRNAITHGFVAYTT